MTEKTLTNCCELLRVLAEPARMELIEILICQGEKDVGQIAEQMDQDRSVVSRHLKQLADAGVLEIRKEGRHRHYRINGEFLLREMEDLTGQLRTYIQTGNCC